MGDIFARLFQVWIAVFAAVIFLAALILALAGALSWWAVVCGYAGISAVTLTLAALAFLTRR